MSQLPQTPQILPPPGADETRPFSVLLLFLLLGIGTGCRPSEEPRVVVYTSQDQVYSEPILRQFEAETGVRVEAVYDSEMVKTVGLANQLMAEKINPRCDVFWNNEELRTRQLLRAGVLDSNQWSAFGYRSRRLVINTNLLSLEQAPTRFQDLTNQTWKGKAVLAYPLFGTTATHFFALREHWGEQGWKAWCRALLRNECLVVDGNSVVVQMVGRGEAAVGMTDNDDIAAGQRNGYPIAEVPLCPDTLLIPNTVAMTVGARHPEAARKLMEYLQSSEVIDRLVGVNALQSGNLPPEDRPGLDPDWDALLETISSATSFLEETFLD